METANYILAILKRQLNIVWSWGFHSPQAFQKGLKFKVNGFIHRGWVIVKYNDGTDLFDISLLDINMNIKSEIEGVFFDELVKVIDSAVERTHDYEKQVNDWLNSNTL